MTASQTAQAPRVQYWKGAPTVTNQEVEQSVSTVRGIFEPMIEAGAFVAEGEDIANKITAELEQADIALHADLPKAMAHSLRAETLLNDQVNRKGVLWRARRVYVAPLFLYHLLFLVGLSVLLMQPLAVATIAVFQMPMAAPLTGALGSELRGIYWLQRQVARRIYRPTFGPAHISSPFIGALLAIVAYMLTNLGIMALQAAELAAPQQKSSDPPHANLLLAVCFLSGFKWEWVLERLEKLFKW
jgi:hypothetical protein